MPVEVGQPASHLRRTPVPPGPHGTGLAGADAALDAVTIAADSISLSGWLLSRDYPIDRVRLVVDDVSVGEAAATPREDVGRHFPTVPHAALSGLEIGGARRPGNGPLRVQLVGARAGRDLIVHEQYLRTTPGPQRDLPAPHLISRIAGSPDATMFRDYGLTIAAQMLRAVRDHLPRRGPPRLLDWGCGPGRATQFLAELWPGVQVTGCDLDAEAIAWSRRVMPAARFHVTGPYPPLPFADGSFDAVLAASVMTHLTGPLQLQWLREIRRVLAPGGVFVASVHGPFAAARMPRGDVAELRAAGIVDRLHDDALDGIAPAQYYRGTLQTVEYTYAQWGLEMAILAYQEAGLVNHQDLVVLRRDPASPRWLRRLWS